MVQMIFIPMTRDDALALRSGTAERHYLGCAATPSLAASMDGDPAIEEVEYAALSNAGVLALALAPNAPRLVAAAEVQEEQVEDLRGPHGEIEVRGLTWAQVRALFADEPDALEVATLAGKAIAGQSLAAALITPEVAAVLDGYDLLWFAPEELDLL